MTDQVENQAAEETVQLSLQDISTMVQVIDICSKRGGFEGPEMEAVGGLRNRIVAFVNANAAQQGEQVPDGAVPTEEVVAETVAADSTES